MNKARLGFMLIEAIMTLVIVSICLTFIVQSLLTNFRTGIRFQETVRSLIALENRLDLLFATSGSEDMVDSSSQTLDEPYEKFSVSAQTEKEDDHLKKVKQLLSWPIGKSQGQIAVTTIIYNPNEN